MTRASRRASAPSAQASATPQGRSTAISFAKEGPDSTAHGERGSASASTSGISARLPRSRPLEQLTTGVPGARCGARRPAISRMRCAGGASSRNSAPATASAMSLVARIPAGRRTPGRKCELTPWRLMSSATSGSRAQIVTSFPDLRATQAIAVPKAPPPITPMRAICLAS